MRKSTLDITPSPRLLAVLGDIPLHPWQCLAELVDNSLDELLKLPDRHTRTRLLSRFPSSMKALRVPI